MEKTSFGEMEILLRDEGRARIEHLKFEREGRAHRHDEFESFYVMRGAGKVFIQDGNGERAVDVRAGSLVVIPPGAAHRMQPGEGAELEGLLWYHREALCVKL